MFTVDSVVEQGVKTAKTMTAFISNKDLRSEVENFIDAQANYALAMHESSTRIGKAIYNTALNK
jgi:hypothetical protein